MLPLSRHTKLTLMFTPLLIGFIALGVIVYDLKNPVSIEFDDCIVIGTGVEVSAYKTTENTLFDEGGYATHNIGFKCERRGTVVINDATPFQLGSVFTGNGAVLIHKQYRILNGAWRINVRNPIGQSDNAPSGK